jgi:hypothetical protein
MEIYYLNHKKRYDQEVKDTAYTQATNPVLVGHIKQKEEQAKRVKIADK